MSHPLQNHPGTRKLPIGVSPALSRYGRDRLRVNALAGGVLILILGICIYAAFQSEHGPPALLGRAGGSVTDALRLATPEERKFNLIMVVVPVALLLCIVAGFFVGTLRPLREQRAYYRLQRHAAPTVAQLRNLRIAGVWSYHKQFWPTSLEFWPMGKGIAERKHGRFRTFGLQTVAEEREQTASDWAILHRTNASDVIESILAVGVHSREFAARMELNGLEYAEALAAQTDADIARIYDELSEKDGRPARLVWGYDLIRAHHIARSAFMADFFDRETAERYLARITDCVAELFHTEEEFAFNLRLGFAVWAGPTHLHGSVERREVFAEYFRSEWVGKLGPWPRPSGCELPENMRSGYAADRAMIREQLDAERAGHEEP